MQGQQSSFFAALTAKTVQEIMYTRTRVRTNFVLVHTKFYALKVKVEAALASSVAGKPPSSKSLGTLEKDVGKLVRQARSRAVVPVLPR